MTLVALTAAKGSPGVSTCALALALLWPSSFPGRRVLLVDADVAGGGPVSAFQRHGLGDGRGLLAWAAAPPAQDRLERQLLALAGEDRWLLAGLPDPAGAAALSGRWTELGADLQDLQADRDLDVIVDLGRAGARHEARPLLAGADAVLLVLRSTFESVTLTRGVLSGLQTGPGIRRTGALLVGARDPYSAREVGHELGIAVTATLSHDPRGAAALASGPYDRALRSRSALLRSTQVAVTALASVTQQAVHA